MDAKDQALNVARNCFAVRLRKLNRVVSRHYDECFRPFGLTVAQFNLLVAIAAREGTTPSELVASLSLEKSRLASMSEEYCSMSSKSGSIRFRNSVGVS